MLITDLIITKKIKFINYQKWKKSANAVTSNRFLEVINGAITPLFNKLFNFTKL